MSAINYPPMKDTMTMNALGTTAISRVSPTNPLGGLGQFLGELRQLPSVPDILKWKSKIKKFRSLAKGGSSEYLNVQFGWIPFVSDIYKLARSAVKHGALIKQYDRDSGRNIRRRYTFPDDSVTTVTSQGTGGGSPVLTTALYDNLGSKTLTTKTETKSWFSGAFTYYLPPANSPKLGDRIRRAEQLANHLYGARISPQTLYQLAPWSWALGWVTNMNDIVNNWSNFHENGLVMRYGYIMSKTTVTNTYAVTGLKLKGQSPISLSQTYVYETKQRAKATPYGFGLSPSSLSAKQWSIIGALGISKAPRSFNF